MSKQAERIIEKFGGARRLAFAIGLKPSAVYRWTYTAERGGTGGLVPTQAMPKVKEAAELLSIDLSAEDLSA